jgi:membrane associated rhomboid family serine protease
MASNNYYSGGHGNSYGDADRYGHAPDTTHLGSSTSKPLDTPSYHEPSPYSSTTYLDDTHQSSGSGQQRSHANPFNTPFDDDSYSSTYNHSNPSLHQPYQSYANAHDPFSDSSAIPLEPQSQKYPGQESPMTGMADAEQQFPPDQPKERIPSRQGGWFKKKITWAVYLLSTVQFAVFLGELIKNATLTGSPFEIHPQFNIMIGPSPYVIINMGARYVPCMREYNVTGQSLTLADPSVAMPCPNATSNVAQCNLAQLCGFGLDLTPHDGVQPQPNQWFRFITPIFLHGGIIHIGFNQLLQLTLGRDVERQIGTLRFVLVYFSAGIFGFVLGGNYAPNGIMSSGCSGSLFGIIAIVLLDLLYTWRTRRNPVRELIFIMLDIVVAFILGLLPGLDNFSHIGGFLTGLVLGICILHSPDALRERIGVDSAPYRAALADGGPEPQSGVQNFVRAPVGFFKARKPLWWAWWLIRAGALVAVTIAFIVLLRNFYVYRVTCAWCKYLSCLVSLSLSLVIGLTHIARQELV